MLGWFEIYTHKNECPKIINCFSINESEVKWSLSSLKRRQANETVWLGKLDTYAKVISPRKTNKANWISFYLQLKCPVQNTGKSFMLKINLPWYQLIHLHNQVWWGSGTWTNKAKTVELCIKWAITAAASRFINDVKSSGIKSIIYMRLPYLSWESGHHNEHSAAATWWVEMTQPLCLFIWVFLGLMRYYDS